MNRTLALAFALTLALAGCGDSTDAGSPSSPGASGSPGSSSGRLSMSDLAGNTYNAGPGDVTGHNLVPGSTLSLTFDQHTVGARAGCNQLSGAATLQNDTLKVSQLAGTEMGCAPRLMDQDTWVSGFLTSDPAIALDGDQLTLTSGKETITLTQESNEPAPLVGTHWRVDGVIHGAGDSGSVSSIPPAAADAGFVIKGHQINVNTGCNTGSGSVTYTDDTITAGPIAMTMRACADPAVNQLEQTMLKILSTPASYTIEKDTMRLTTPDGKVGLMLRVR